MNINRRKLLKGSITLLSISVVPYSGYYAYQKTRSKSISEENHIPEENYISIDNNSNLLINHDLGNIDLKLNNEDIEMISAFTRGENKSKIYSLIKSDYQYGRTLYSNSFNYSITEIKIALYRRSIAT